MELKTDKFLICNDNIVSMVVTYLFPNFVQFLPSSIADRFGTFRQDAMHSKALCLYEFHPLISGT